VYFQILDDLGVTVADEWRPISAGRQRAAFCVLALASNRAVSRAALVDAIWGERIPQHPDTALQIIVSRLRTTLGAAASRLVSVPSGYRLDVAADELDVTLVQSQFILGRSLLHDNEPHRAAEVLDRALRSWGDEILADLREFPLYSDAFDDLRNLRNSIEQSYNDALLASARHVEVLARLQGAIAADPWREDLRRQRMIALYRSGRQVEALREFDEFRAFLIDELGIEPTEELRELHVRILDHDASLLVRKSGVQVPVPPWTATSMPFVGRSDEEERIFSRLRDVGNGGRGFILIEGEAGIGKTRLMMEVARRMSDDTILVPANANDATRGTLVALAEALTAASAQLSDAELQLCLGQWPGDVAATVPALARRLAGAVALDLDDKVHAERLRESLISWVVTLSHRAPVVILIDDIDRAGPALFMFLGRLFERMGHQRVLVVATARSREVDGSSKLEQLLVSLQRLECLDRLSLEGLDESSLERLLASTGAPDAAMEARRLMTFTRGHPFFIGELVQSGDWDATVPMTVRDFVRQRVRSLGLQEQRTLEHAAGFFRGFSIPLLAEAAGITDAVATRHVDRALEAAILRSYGPRSYTFVHELTRRSLTESQDADTRAQIHRQIALALEKSATPPAILAEHWRRATGDDAREKVFEYASQAARQAMQSLGPETAIRFLQLAVRSAPSAAQEARAWMALAEAQHEAGDAACLTSLRTAIDYARAHQDTDLLIACASMWTPIWSSMPALEVAERIALLQDACDMAADASIRSRLRARLASELLHSNERHRAAALAREALDEVNATDSCPAKREVSMRYFHATWSPHTLAERRTLIAQTVAHTPEQDVLDRCFALSLQGAAAVEAVDIDAANTALDEMLALADAQAISSLQLNATTTRAWRLALAGHMEQATELATAALARARAERDPRAVEGAALQLGLIAWQRGRLGNLLPLFRAIDPGTAGVGATNLLIARASVSAGDADGARELLASIDADDLDGLPKDLMWASSLVMAAEAAFMLGLDRFAADIYFHLEPFQSQVAFANFVVGPIAYGAALAAAASQEQEFDALFGRALEICDQLQAPVLRARTEIAWTVASQKSSRTPKQAQRVDLAEDARNICADLQLDDLRLTDDVASWQLV
jgi:DNA-binding SARP family transcriptional activator